MLACGVAETLEIVSILNTPGLTLLRSIKLANCSAEISTFTVPAISESLGIPDLPKPASLSVGCKPKPVPS